MIVKVSIPNRFQFKAAPSFTTMLWQRQGEVHYIGGADILPPPLDAKEETEMIARLGTEREKEARSLLIEHNLRLVVYIAKKFDNTCVGVEDLISIGTIGLMKAINTFNPAKNIKLATYASRCIENEILMYLRKNANRRGEVSLDEPLNTDWDGNELLLSDVYIKTLKGRWTENCYGRHWRRSRRGSVPLSACVSGWEIYRGKN